MFSSISAKFKNRLSRPGRVAVVVAIAVVLAGGFIQSVQSASGTHGSSNLVTVERGSIEEVVTSQGKLEPREYVDVGAQVSGQLKKIHVEIGEQVKAGELLAEIDPKIYEARVQADKARLRTLEAQRLEQEAQIAFARNFHERNKVLIAAKAISAEALEESLTNLKVAEARMSSLQAQIEEAQSALEGDEVNLSYTKIYAPIDGTVVAQTAREGQTLNANQSAPVIVQLANLSQMTVRAQVAEADVMRLKPGMEVYFTTLGAMERRWSGKVRQILPSPEVVNDVVLYNALVDVENGDGQLMTGMSTQMFFVLGRAKDVALLPLSAIGGRRPDRDSGQGQAYQVRVMSSGKPTERIVHLGLMSRTHAEIRSGLQIGDRVVASETAVSEAEGSRRRGFRRGPHL